MRRSKKVQKAVSSLMILAGCLLIFYPVCAHAYNQYTSSKASADYEHIALDMTSTQKQSILLEAKSYNTQLASLKDTWNEYKQLHSLYEKSLSNDANGILCTLHISKLNLDLPVYKDADVSKSMIGASHFEGSSLPVGGMSTHTVITAHSGLAQSELFTRLDEMEVGDTFTLQVLDQSLVYEVKKIQIVDPDQLDTLDIISGEDWCTLLTCTPIGINTQRLLVQGQRISQTSVSSNTSNSFKAILLLTVLLSVELFLFFSYTIHSMKRKLPH
jgi:sortase A